MFYVCRYCCHCTKCGACPCTTPSWPTAWSSSWKRTPPSPSLSLCPCLGRDNNITSSKIMCTFFASGGGSPLYPEIFTVLLNDPAAPQDHCGRSRIRTRDFCLRSLARYQWATSSPDSWATTSPWATLSYSTSVDSALVTKTSTANAAKELKRNLPTLNNITHHSMQKQQRFHIYGEKSIKIQC